jgi:hypothetical protein
MTFNEVVMFWRQAVNNYLFVMDLVLDGILLLYIMSYIKTYGRDAWKMVRIQAATWMVIHIIGLTLQRLWGIVLLRAYFNGRDSMAVEGHFPVFFVGSIIACIGVAGTIYTFTPIAGSDGITFWRRIMPLVIGIVIATMFTVILLG